MTCSTSCSVFGHRTDRRGVAVLGLTNGAVNSLSVDVRQGILRGLVAAKRDQAKAVVLHGKGSNFSAVSSLSPMSFDNRSVTND
jgi:enoyl-CoA hydratase/carnithine racemase